MKSAILLTAATAVQAQQGNTPTVGLPGLAGLPAGLDIASLLAPKANCDKNPPPQNLDPMVQFAPQSVNWPCDFGKPVPYGKVPKGCAKFEVIVARGTSEPGPFGTVVGDPLVARVIRDMPGKDVRGYPVQYPAGAEFFPKQGESIAALLEKLDAGPRDVVNRIATQIKECPDERFALVGYSQGGGVIALATTRLTPQQLDKIDAVVTYGAMGSFPKTLEKKWLNNCAPGDMCGGDAGTEGHLSYNHQGTVWHDRSAKYIADAFNGKPQGQVFAKTSKT